MNKSNRSIKKENSIDRENDMECSQFKEGQCIFCSNIDVIRCVWMSVIRKHNDEDNFEVKLMESILDEDSQSPVLKKFRNYRYTGLLMLQTRYMDKNWYNPTLSLSPR